MPRRLGRSSFLTSLLCTTAITVHAQPVTRMPDVVVTGSRIETPLHDRLTDVSLITREEIERAGQSSLADVLRMTQGVEFVTNGGPGSSTSVFMRGASNAQVIVLIDGQRVGSSTTGTANWQALPLSQIDRIEILRGPASSLYGADAIGGVVQIFTRQGGGPTAFDAEFGGGSYNTWRIGAGVRGGDERFRYSLRGGYEDSQGFNAIRNREAFGFNPDLDGNRQGNVSGQFGYTVAQGHELGLQFLENRQRGRYDVSANFDDRIYTTIRSVAATSTNRLTPIWTSRLRLGETADLSDNVSATDVSRFNTHQRQYAWQNDIGLGDAKLQLALERREERLFTTFALPTNTRDTNSGVGVLQWTPGNHILQASARQDNSTQYGGRTTGALGYGYRLGGGWRLAGNAGTAFRAPTFLDLYFPLFDNPNLKPEHARNAEGGVYYETAATTMSAVYYRNRVEDLIVFSGTCPLSGRPFGCPVNVNSAKLQGWSLAARTAVTREIALRGTLDLAQPTDVATGHVLPRRAKRYGSAAVDYNVAAWRLTAELIAAGQRFDDAANTKRMGGYALVNLVASYALDRQWSLFARWNNVLDHTYELAKDFSTPAANVFLGVRYQSR